MFPSILSEVVEYLNSVDIEISEAHTDGRINSIFDEGAVVRILQKKYGEENIIDGEDRYWWDYKIYGYPVQFKSSGFKGADNWSSKAGILYALTDLPEEDCNIVPWAKFQETLKLNSSQLNPRDYHIIVLNKVTNEVYLTSLKSLNTLTSNGNNLPFQIKWKDNVKSFE